MARLRSSSAAEARPQAGLGASPAERRTAFAEDSPASVAPADTPSTAMRLLAEVKRLQAELLAMRSRMAELEANANIDPLLKIFNRRGFMRELDRALAYVKRYGTSAALVYLDLDRFKPVNDIHGHAAGDAVLQAVATTLTGNVRASDTVARLGGDEFVALLWNLDEPKAVAKAAALERKIAETDLPWGEIRLAVGASVGVTMLGPHDQAAAILARADRAMYDRKAARRAGRETLASD